MNVPPRFLSIGECMAELAPLELVGDFRLGYAGDTFNTAWYLRRLRPDMHVAYHTAVGTDDLSTDMVRFMDNEGIGTTSIARLPERSVGLYLISLKDGERSFSYWRDTSAARRLADEEAVLFDAVNAADLIYFSGITLAILSESARGKLFSALRHARSQGKTIAFDPNLRPRLWSDVEQMKKTIMQGAGICDIALPSFEDEATHFADGNAKATIQRYRGAGASCVIVKNGRGAVHYSTSDGSGSIEVPELDSIVDTTAAGDSFNAGFFATIDQPLTIAERISVANAVAGRVVGGRGALIRVRPTDLRRAH